MSITAQQSQKKCKENIFLSTHLKIYIILTIQIIIRNRDLEQIKKGNSTNKAVGLYLENSATVLNF